MDNTDKRTRNNTSRNNIIILFALIVIIGLLFFSYSESFETKQVKIPDLSKEAQDKVTASCGEDPIIIDISNMKASFKPGFNDRDAEEYRACVWLSESISFPINKWFYDYRINKERILRAKIHCGISLRSNTEAYDACVELNSR